MVSSSCESAFASSIFTNQSSIFFHKDLQSVPVVFFFFFIVNNFHTIEENFMIHLIEPVAYTDI